MPRPSCAPWHRWLATCVFLALIAGSPARAYDFVLLGNGSDQHLTAYWELGNPVLSCTTQPTPCVDAYATNGNIPFVNQSGQCQFMGCANTTKNVNTGGSLQWTGADSLRVVGLNVAQATVSANIFGSGGYVEMWDALDVRSPTLRFLLLADPGDPSTTNLRIHPRLDGSFTHITSVGGFTYVFLQMAVAVSVNGAQVARDSLYTEWTYANDADDTLSVSFPKGAANVVTVNVPVNSQIEIQMWGFVRMSVSCDGPSRNARISTSSSVSNSGTAMIVSAQTLGTTAVGEPVVHSGLSLAASPNPTTGPTRFSYVLPRAGQASLSVYDVAGHRVDTVLDRWEEPGLHEATWTGRKADGSVAPAGVYLVELAAGSERIARRVIVLGR